MIKVKRPSFIPTLEVSVVSLYGIAPRVGLHKIQGARNMRSETPS